MRNKQHLRKHTIGSRFGRLVIVEELGYYKNSNKIRLVKCRCDCGGVCITIINSLIARRTVSCGCRLDEIKSKWPGNNKLPDIERWHARVKNNYNGLKKFHKLGCTITFPEYLELTQLPCNYCGAVPREIFLKRRKVSYQANGIDRIDSALGYNPGNVVPCCTTCNIAKSTMSVLDFKAWIKRAYLHQNSHV